MTNGTQALAVITACQQSHQFQDRRDLKVPLGEDYVKVGRSVARLKPMEDNCIFDCKVLSRNHAVIWYEDQSFFLKDTKSSNGTFVNNERLSKGAEESPPKEIFSGDIIQFGVDIIENAKKVTHGCIIAMVRLYHPDGHESVNTSRSIPEDSLSVASTAMGVMGAESLCVPPGAICISSSELFQLHQYIKEASHREAMLESKLGTLQGLVAATQDASETNWKALVDEDRLLSRIEMLEAQLATYSKAATEDKLRDEVIGLQKEKESYESAAKESLRRALDEKVEAMSKMSDVERALETTEEEVSRLREVGGRSEEEMAALRTLHETTLSQAAKSEADRDEWKSRAMDAERRLSESQLQSPTLAETQFNVSHLKNELDATRAELEKGRSARLALAASDVRLHSLLTTATSKLYSQLDGAVKEDTLQDFTKDVEKQIQEMLKQEFNEEIEVQREIVEETKELRAAKEDLAKVTSALEKMTNQLNTVQIQRLEKTEEAAQSLARACQSESLVEQLRRELSTKMEEMEFEKRMRADAEASTSATDQPNDTASPKVKDESRAVFHRQAAKNQAEFATLKDECGRMRERIVAIEGEMKASRKENARLASENRQLQETVRSVGESSRAVAGQKDWQFEAEALKMDTERIANELREAKTEAESACARAVRAETEAAAMRSKLCEVGVDPSLDLPFKDQIMGALHGLPLLMIVIAIVCAFFPFFAAYTYTTEPSLPDNSS